MSQQLLTLSVRSNIHLYAFTLALIAVGVVVGGLLVQTLDLTQEQALSDLLREYVGSLSSKNSSEGVSFWDSFFFYGKWLVLIWLLGLSVVGMPFVFVLDFLKGVLIGFAVALLVEQMAWKGLLLFLLATVPHNLFVVPALLIATVSAGRFSRYLIADRLIRRRGNLLTPFIAHCTACGLLLPLAACAALLEAYGSPLLLARAAEFLSGASI